MITKARKWIMVASLMLTMCFAINNSTSAKAAVVTIMAQLSRQKFDVFIMN